MNCWVCGGSLEEGEPSIPAPKVPRRLRAHEGKPVHLRCVGEWADVVAPVAPAREKPARPALKLKERNGFLYAEDIAARRGISPRQARRWLERLEEMYGHRVVGRVDGRRGVRRYTTEAALEMIGPGRHLPPVAVHP